jgi:hypothetical protein
MIQYGRIIHAVKNGSDKAIQTPNIPTLLNKANENKLIATLHPEVNYLPDDLAISCTSVVPECEEQNGRITQKIDTIIAKFPQTPLTKLLSLQEKTILMQRYNQHYAFVQKLLQYQTSHDIDIKTHETIEIPNLNWEG